MIRKITLLAAAALLVLPAAASAQMQDKMARPGHGGGHRPNPGGGHRPTPLPGPGGHHGGNRPNPGHGGGHHRPPIIVRPPIVIRPPHHGGGWNGHRPNHHWGQYHYPRGHSNYRRWHTGLILPSIFFGSNYWFNDWHRYGVYAPHSGYRWVRYGPDLLLVNTRNGHIRDVRYGFFA